MKKNKARPNDPCPCGSGKKFKKCCGAGGRHADPNAPPYTRDERAAAIEKLFFYIEDEWADAEARLFDRYWGPYRDREGELPEGFAQLSVGVFEGWLAFDHRRPDGRRLVDHFLATIPTSRGERAYLEAMRDTSLRLYRVTDLVPGVSVTLRDLLEGTVVKVRERSASRSMTRQMPLAARVIAQGASGAPELESGLLPLAELGIEQVVDAVRAERDRVVAAAPPGAALADGYEGASVIVHHHWLASIFDPAVPELQNNDGDTLAWTRVHFDVLDPDALTRALDAAARAGLTATSDHEWSWSGPDARGQTVSLGTLTRRDTTLTLEANSVARGERGRALLERIAGPTLSHRATSHEDMRRKLKDSMTARLLGREDPVDAQAREPAHLDPDLAEALVMQHYARHYHAWIDEPVPALDGATPRAAAKRTALRPRLEELLRGLEGMYERALKDGQPAYDPSWMWAELRLRSASDASHPPQLAHERVAERAPGSAAACRAVAERLRAHPDFDAATTVANDDDIARDLDLQRLLRAPASPATDAHAPAHAAAPYIGLMVDLELHRRKIFWVDEALAYMLENTDVDLAGSELRAPFPSFALALTDRHALALGERLLARRDDDPLRGQILRVITVFASERRAGDARTLALTFAFDALGADLPSLARFEAPTDDAAALGAYLGSLGPAPVAGPDAPDTSPSRALVRLALNAVRYATSAGVTPEVRTAPPRRARKPATGGAAAATGPSPRTAETVYFLPGTIDIYAVRQLQALERAPGGRTQLARYMVRGHWRRAQERWVDQRPRWIAPYWKGPDLAAIIEKAYRLRP